jgi:mono/diheme cytochrome c family protein
MTVSRILLCAMQVGVALCALSPTAQGQTASIARGQEIAERACMGCHAAAGSSSRRVEGLDVPSFASIAARPYQTPQRLQSFVMTPHRPMPGMSLSLADVNDVVAYLLSLK